MIVVRMELWPGGDQSRAQDLGVAVIANEGESAMDSHPAYSVRLLKAAKFSKRPGEVWRAGKVPAYPRAGKRWGPWELLALALEATIKDRLISLRAYLDRRKSKEIDRLAKGSKPEWRVRPIHGARCPRCHRSRRTTPCALCNPGDLSGDIVAGVPGRFQCP